MNAKRSLSKVSVTFFVVSSIAFLVLAAYSLWLDRSATAAIAGALSFAFLLLIQLPYLESMEILTLKVKLKERLSDAERLTEQLRETASVSARLMYIQLSFMNRLGTIPWDRKRSLLTEIERNLSQLNVPREKIAEYKLPFLNIVSFDLYLIFSKALGQILDRYQLRINEEISSYAQGRPIPADDQEYQDLLEKRKSFAPKQHDFHDVLADPRLTRVREVVVNLMSQYPLSAEDRAKLKIIGDEISSLSEECWIAGTITVPAERYLNKYQLSDSDRLRELEIGSDQN